MNDDTHPTNQARVAAHHGNTSGGEVVTPAPAVWAIVRFAPLPDQPPGELLPYTIRQAEDWVLTDDALAFGGADIIRRFNGWRSTWERTWTLDPLPNLSRLAVLGRQLQPGSDGTSGVFGRDVMEFLIDGSEAELSLERAVTIGAALGRLADQIRERGASGYGIVDKTPHCARVGLARSWPECGDTEVVASADDVRVVFEPDAGLYVEVDRGADPVRFGPIDHVERNNATWTVSDGDGRLHLRGDEGRALSWIVPGATAWGVRAVPEVVVWARTFGGFADSLEFAERTGAPIRLTATRLIADQAGAVNPT
jgi:hypothetical protein